MLEKYFNFRLDEKTHRKLWLLADNLQRTKSNLIRWLITEEYKRQSLDFFKEHKIHADTALGNSQLSHKKNNEEGFK